MLLISPAIAGVHNTETLRARKIGNIASMNRRWGIGFIRWLDLVGCNLTGFGVLGNSDGGGVSRSFANRIGVEFEVVWEILGFKDYFDFYDTGDQ